MTESRLFFLREHIAAPYNEGEVRECIKILEKCGNVDGLFAMLATDGAVSYPNGDTCRRASSGQRKTST